MEEHRRAAFNTFAERKLQEASASTIHTLTTIFDRNGATDLRGIGNAWTRVHYGGDFSLAVAPPNRANVSLVFVQSRDGNTEAADPSVFGAGATDKHLIYEGLSRVAADAVLVGARTVHSEAFFSVWHPELIELRASLGFPRHPAQVVVSKRGHVDLASLLFNVPDVPVFLIGGDECFLRHADALQARPWIRRIPLADAGLTSSLDHLRLEHGIHRISAVGGRSTATRLVDERLARDLYLTTGPCDGGVINTPWYAGAASPTLTVTTRKQWVDAGAHVVFEHVLITGFRDSSK
jgi:riboflavin biosynthesis pyrimidine reductase